MVSDFWVSCVFQKLWSLGGNQNSTMSFIFMPSVYSFLLPANIWCLFQIFLELGPESSLMLTAGSQILCCPTAPYFPCHLVLGVYVTCSNPALPSATYNLHVFPVMI